MIRDAVPEDAERLVEIYDHYVRHTAITFEYDTPSIREFRGRMEKIMQRWPYLVILKDGRIEGYAYANAFHSRAAYGWCSEVTIYLDAAVKKCGLGRRLYEALEGRLERMGILNLYACIGYPEHADEYLSRNSIDFHAHLGYRIIGEFKQCGYKFGRWYHMAWMEKIIGEHTQPQAAVVPYPELETKDLDRS